jgi:predicted DNA-binding transcriptional regulator YafY
MPAPLVTYGEKKLTRAQRWALILPTMRRPYPLQGLADLCGVSLRQINRDIRELRDLGHRIEIKHGRAFFAEGAAPADFMLAQLFSSELRYLIDFASAFGISQIADSIESLFRAAPEIERAPVLPLITSHSPLALDDANRSALKTLQRAIDQHHVITFVYHDKRNAETLRTVRPVIFVIHQGVPYCVAFDTKRSAWRTFNTTRMTDITLTPNTFPAYDREKVLQALEHSPSRLFTGTPELLNVRFIGVAAVHARRSHVVSASPSMIERNGELIVDLLAADRRESFLWLLGFGELVEVLGPPEARQEFAELAASIARRHASPHNTSAPPETERNDR